MICSNCRNAVATSFYWTGHGAGRIARHLCADCLIALNRIGMGWQPERRSDPARPDRRPFRPAWMERLTAREDASWRAA